MPYTSTGVNRIEKLLSEEIHEITNKMPEELKGLGPVIVSVYQPTATGWRLVIISKRHDEVNKVAEFNPSQGGIDFFLNPESNLQRVFTKPFDSAKKISYIKSNHEIARLDIQSVYQERFRNIKMDNESGLPDLGRVYRICYLCPTPQLNMRPVLRFPRLGSAYTFGKDYDNTRLRSAADEAGKVVFDVRLKRLLQEVQFGPRDRRNSIRSAWDIAADLGEGSTITLDESIFLICKLLLTHHFLYPHSPAAYSLINRLSKEPAQVFKRHGLDAPVWLRKGDKTEFDQLTNNFKSDFLSIVGACARKRNVDSTHAIAVSENGESLFAEGLPIALTLLCGSVGRRKVEKPIGSGRHPKESFSIIPPPGLPHFSGQLPTFAYEDVKRLAGEEGGLLRAGNFIETLHPLGTANINPSARGFYTTSNQGWVNFNGERVSKPATNDWFVFYVRARCIKSFQALESSP